MVQFLQTEVDVRLFVCDLFSNHGVVLIALFRYLSVESSSHLVTSWV